jgi:hypothetical protein
MNVFAEIVLVCGAVYTTAIKDAERKKPFFIYYLLLFYYYYYYYSLSLFTETSRAICRRDLLAKDELSFTYSKIHSDCIITTTNVGLPLMSFHPCFLFDFII